MGIKQTTCSNCNCIKETQKHLCKFPAEWGQKMSYCSGRIPYKWIYQEAAEYVTRNYKTFQ